MNRISKRLLLIILPVIMISCGPTSQSPIYIRATQVGFLPGNLKTAVVMSQSPISQKEFLIINSRNKTAVYSSVFQDSIYSFGKFKYCFALDFSKLKSPGSYQIETNGQTSEPFKIGNSIFNNVVDSLMLFFREQRCGPTDPILHKPCHLSDVVRLIGDKDLPDDSSGVDLTGGWHDAGDYIKFLSTTAYTTYMLIFSYDFDKNKFGFDNDKNGVPDVLEEAKIGLDWMLRCNYSKYKLVTQVQDLRDHGVGWRLPENDTLRYDRPGYVGIGKNQIGMFAATMALASRVWSQKFYKYDFAKKCLDAAENLYSIRDKVPNIDSSQSGFYQDSTFWGKLALGAAELYLTTKKPMYLDDAIKYADSAGSDYWWSYGNLNSLADYRLAKIIPRFSNYILNNLISFDARKDSSVFHEGLVYTWGSTNSFLGVALQAILYKNITGNSDYDSLATFQRDYVLGRNPWGLSFIYDIGSVYPVHLHSQVGYFHGGYLPGALSAGPAPEAILKNYKIVRQDNKYDFFNTDDIKYYDDYSDYITNEPTITGNATALFVYGYYSHR
ncbi:MAG: glycoside hydrolase family 9 protein [Ignavibacteriaceae bacterium]